MMFKNRLAIIGTGNMGRAILSGILSKNIISSEELAVSNPKIDSVREIINNYNVPFYTDNTLVIQEAEIILLAVKPQILLSVLKEIQPSLSQNQVILSIAAGISIKKMKQILGNSHPVIRAMPNLAAKVGESMTGWIASEELTPSQKDKVRRILQTFGQEIELNQESQIDTVTAISGSGPAYLFYFLESLIADAIKLGIPQEQAYDLVLQTAIGSIKTLQVSRENPDTLRKQVTSPGGTTEAAIERFEKEDLQKILFNGVQSAYERAKQLNEIVSQ